MPSGKTSERDAPIRFRLESIEGSDAYYLVGYVLATSWTPEVIAIIHTHGQERVFVRAGLFHEETKTPIYREARGISFFPRAAIQP